MIGIGRKTSDCQGNTKYFRCKYCNFTYMGSSSSELEQHFLSSHPNKVKTPPTTPMATANNLATHDNQLKGRSQNTEGVERVAVRADDDALAGYCIPGGVCSDSLAWTGEDGQGATQGYYLCKSCSWSCDWSGGSAKLLEHYEQRHRGSPGEAVSPSNATERGGRRDVVERDDMAFKSCKDHLSNPSSTSKGLLTSIFSYPPTYHTDLPKASRTWFCFLLPGDPNCSDSEAVVTSYNCQLCDFRYSMAHNADVIVVAPLLLHYQHNHSIHRCCIQHCMYCPQGHCQPHKHLGEVRCIKYNIHWVALQAHEKQLQYFFLTKSRSGE